MASQATDPACAALFAALDRAPMTWRHYLVWLAASGGALTDGWSVSTLGLALPLLKNDFALTPTMIGLFGSALLFGAVTGAWAGGLLADRYGRKRLLLADMALVAAAAGLVAGASAPWVIIAGQFLIGVAIGADFPTSAAYVSEMTPRRTRSRMTVATIAMQSVGMIAAALAALLVLKLDPARADWRIMFAGQGVLALVFLGLRALTPESLRWLAVHGDMPRALALLPLFSTTIDNASASAASSAPAAGNDASAAGHGASAAGLGLLFGKAYRARTTLAALPWTLMDVGTYGVGLFTPVILGAFHLQARGAGAIGADIVDAEGSAAVDLFLLLGFLASIWAVPRFGRIPMQVAGFAGMALGMLLLLFATLAGDGAGAHLTLVMIGFILFNFTMNLGPNATTFTLPPTLFPTAVRGAASGFAAGCAKVGATLGAFVVPQLQAAAGLSGVIALMVLISVAGLVSTGWLAHEVNEEGALEE